MLKLKVEVAKGFKQDHTDIKWHSWDWNSFQIYLSVSGYPGHYHLYISFPVTYLQSLCFLLWIFIILLTFLYQEIYF